MPKLNVKRLTILRDHLKTLSDDVYHQGTWSLNSDYNDNYIGCGFGHATKIPAFQKLGVTGPGFTYKGLEFEPALTKFFGINENVAGWLSIGGYRNHTSPKEMIARLTAIIDGKFKEDGMYNGKWKVTTPRKVKVVEPA